MKYSKNDLRQFRFQRVILCVCVHVCTEREEREERERESHRNKAIMSIIILDNPELEKVVRECVLRVGE